MVNITNNQTQKTQKTEVVNAELENLKKAKKELNEKIRSITQGNTYKVFAKKILKELKAIRKTENKNDEEKISMAKVSLKALIQ